MKQQLFYKPLLCTLLACLLFAASGWQTNPSSKSYQAFNDTIPERSRKIKNIDDAVLELEKARVQMETSLKEIDWDKQEKEMQLALKELQLNKLKIKEQVIEALKQVDIAKIQAEVHTGLKEVESAKIKADVETALSKIDFEKMKMELEKVKEIDFEKLEAELRKIQPQIEKSMQSARQGIAKAKEEMVIYQTLINYLHKEGLINKNKNYVVEWKAGELTVDGKKQGNDAVKKHPYLNGKKDFRIEKKDEDFTINNE